MAAVTRARARALSEELTIRAALEAPGSASISVATNQNFLPIFASACRRPATPGFSIRSATQDRSARVACSPTLITVVAALARAYSRRIAPGDEAKYSANNATRVHPPRAAAETHRQVAGGGQGGEGGEREGGGRIKRLSFGN